MLIAVTLFPEATWAVLSRSVIALESKRCQTEPARVGDALPVADDQVGGGTSRSLKALKSKAVRETK